MVVNGCMDDVCGNTPAVVVAGMGLICPLGHGVWPAFSALLDGRTLGDRAARVSPRATPAELALASGGVSIVRHTATDPAVELAEFAAREAVFAAGAGLSGLPTYLG